MLSPAEHRYLEELVGRLRGSLPDLVGVYLFGSGAYGDHDPQRSDLDVQVVADPAPALVPELVASVRHRALACPARRLELVVYPHRVARCPRPPLAFALNLNTGAGMVDRITTAADAAEAHWFVLDVAAGRERGVALHGPPVTDLFGPVPRVAVLDALAASLAWHVRHEPTSPNTVLNACRAWHHVGTERWGSKREAADWVLAHRPDLSAVAEALEARTRPRPLRRASVAAVVAEAAGAVHRAAR